MVLFAITSLECGIIQSTSDVFLTRFSLMNRGCFAGMNMDYELRIIQTLSEVEYE